MKATKSRPVFSIVIPAFNEEAKLPATLESLRAQDFTLPYEVIVVDNNSTDKTALVAKKYGATVIRETQKGVTYARQAGFLAAKAPYIATTDADALLPTNWLTTLYREFKKGKNIAVVAGQQVFSDAPPVLDFLMWLSNATLLRLPYWCVGNNLAVKRSYFDKVGGFDTSLLLYEDQDITNRIRKHGRVVKITTVKSIVSARRYNQLGILAGMWDYNKTYLKSRYLGWMYKGVEFTPGSVIKRAKRAKNSAKKVGYYSFLAIVILVSIMISPFRNTPKVKKTIEGTKTVVVAGVRNSMHFIQSAVK